MPSNARSGADRLPDQAKRLATLYSWNSLRARLLEPLSVKAILPHLNIQGLVIGSEEPRRLALVPSGDLEGPADRLLLGIRRSPLGDFFQRGPDRRRLFAECGLRDCRRRVDGENREVLRLNHIRSEQNGPANDVPELPDVSRPVVAQKDLGCRF